MDRLTSQIDCKATKGETKQCKTPAASKAIPTEVGKRKSPGASDKAKRCGQAGDSLVDLLHI